MNYQDVLELNRQECIAIVNWFPFVEPKQITKVDQMLIMQLMDAVTKMDSSYGNSSIYLDKNSSKIAMNWFEYCIDGLVDEIDIETCSRIESFLNELAEDQGDKK